MAIARALAHGPSIVLADEPTGNLDTEASREVFALLRRQHRERGTEFLVVTHDARIAAACDRVVRIVDGRIASGQGGPSADRSADRVQRRCSVALPVTLSGLSRARGRRVVRS